MRTQVYYTVAVLLCHNSNSKWRQWCCEKFQKSRFCTQSRQNNIWDVGIPFPSWAPQPRFCLWISEPHSSKSLWLPPGAKPIRAKGHLWGLQLRDPVTAHGVMDRKISNIFVNFPDLKPTHIELSQQKTSYSPLTSSEEPVYKIPFICSGPGCHSPCTYLGIQTSWICLPSSDLQVQDFFFPLLVGVAIAPARILWHVADDDTIHSWCLSGWQSLTAEHQH